MRMEEDGSKDRVSFIRKIADFLFGYDFFISYCWADGRKYAVALQKRLNALGFNCFLDSSDYAKGDNWRQQGRRALKKTSRLILVGTPKALESEPVANELRIFSELGRRVFPIDFGGALSKIGSTEGVLAYLDPEVLRVNESQEALVSGPSGTVLAEIQESFNLLRQDQKRMRWFAGATAVFAAIAAVAIVLGVLAENRRIVADQKTREVQENLTTNNMTFGEIALKENRPEEAVWYFWRAVASAPEDDPRIPSALRLVGAWGIPAGATIRERTEDGEGYPVLIADDGENLCFRRIAPPYEMADDIVDAERSSGILFQEPFAPQINTPSVRPTLVSPCGRWRLEIGGQTGHHLQMFETASDRLLHERRFDDRLELVVFAPGGDTYMTTSGETGDTHFHWETQYWDTYTGLPLCKPIETMDEQKSTLSADGKWALTKVGMLPEPAAHQRIWRLPEAAAAASERLQITVELCTGFIAETGGQRRVMTLAERTDHLTRLEELGGLAFKGLRASPEIEPEYLASINDRSVLKIQNSGDSDEPGLAGWAIEHLPALVNSPPPPQKRKRFLALMRNVGITGLYRTYESVFNLALLESLLENELFTEGPHLGGIPNMKSLGSFGHYNRGSDYRDLRGVRSDPRKRVVRGSAPAVLRCASQGDCTGALPCLQGPGRRSEVIGRNEGDSAVQRGAPGGQTGAHRRWPCPCGNWVWLPSGTSI